MKLVIKSFNFKTSKGEIILYFTPSWEAWVPWLTRVKPRQISSVSHLSDLGDQKMILGFMINHVHRTCWQVVTETIHIIWALPTGKAYWNCRVVTEIFVLDCQVGGSDKRLRLIRVKPRHVCQERSVLWATWWKCWKTWEPWLIRVKPRHVC